MYRPRSAPGGSSRPARWVRLWDAGVRWDQVEKQRGEFDWERFDTAVSTAQASGAGEIMYILGSTPEWAAKFVRPDTYYYGAGTASEPKKLAYWREWVRAVATPVPGRITSYQIWNEANLSPRSTPRAAQTLEADGAADRHRRPGDPQDRPEREDRQRLQHRDPGQEVQHRVSSTGTCVPSATVASNSTRSASTCTRGPPGPGGGTPRATGGLEMARTVTNKLGFSQVPVWDTEVNYGNRRDNGHATEVFGPRWGGIPARTYVDSLRYDVTGLLVLLGVARDGDQHH